MSPKKRVRARTEPAPRRTDRAAQHWARRRRRRITAGALAGLAIIVLVSHWLEHLGLLRIMTPAAQDLFVGYPTAFLLLIIAGILWGV